jgi:hypothetical protein
MRLPDLIEQRLRHEGALMVRFHRARRRSPLPRHANVRRLSGGIHPTEQGRRSVRGTQARLIWVTFSESCRLQRVTGAGVVIPCAGADRSEISAQGLAIADQCGTTQSGEVRS